MRKLLLIATLIAASTWLAWAGYERNGGGGTPGGSDTQVQFNDGGVFGGDSDLVWDKTNNYLGIGSATAPAYMLDLDLEEQTQSTGLFQSYLASGVNVNDTTNQILLHGGTQIGIKCMSQTGPGAAREMAFIGLMDVDVVGVKDSVGIISFASGAQAANDIIFYADTTTPTGGETPQITIKADSTFVGINKDVPTVALDVVGAGAFTLDVTVPTEVYGAGWNGSLEVPTKDALYDAMQSFLLSPVDIGDDTNLVGGTNITLVDDTLNVDDAFVSNTGGDTMAPTLTISDSATAAPFNISERSSAPSSAANDDMYVDDGTNTASGAPGWMRYTGVAWEDVGSGLGDHGVHITKSTSQSFSHATWTKVEFDSEQWDTDGDYDNSTNYRYTPSIAGKYRVRAQVTFSAPDEAWVGVYKNGSSYKLRRTDYGDDSFHCSTITVIIEMNGTTDYLEIYANQQDGGASNDISTSGTYCFFFAQLIAL